MEQLVIEQVEPSVMERLRLRATQSGRPLQAEVRSILEFAAGCDWQAVSPELQRLQAHFATRSFGDSVELLREERPE